MNVGSIGATAPSHAAGGLGRAGAASGGQKEQMVAKLDAAGISKEQVMRAKADGPDAVRALFRGTGIQPPAQALSGGGGASAAESQTPPAAKSPASTDQSSLDIVA